MFEWQKILNTHPPRLSTRRIAFTTPLYTNILGDSNDSIRLGAKKIKNEVRVGRSIRIDYN